MRLVCALVLHAAAAFVRPRPLRPAVLRAGGDFENPNPFMKEVIDAVPTLQQALSHPYFRPLPGFELDDVQAAYKALVQGAAEGA